MCSTCRSSPDRRPRLPVPWCSAALMGEPFRTLRLRLTKVGEELLGAGELGEEK
jgi:hypothetical protein